MIQRMYVLRVIVLIAVATSLVGLANQPHVAHSQDDNTFPPRVIDIWPAGGAELTPSEVIIITFDQPMDQASVEHAISITPSVKGTFSWMDAQTVTFKPEGGWPRGANLQLLIRKSAMAMSRLPLETEATYRLKIVTALKVASITPSNKSEEASNDSKILISFDRPVVPLTTAEQSENLPAPMTINPAIEGKGRWVNTALYVFTPASPLPGGTSYTVTVPAGLSASDRTTLDAAVTAMFRITLPRIEEIATKSDALPCKLENVGLDCPVRVVFSEPMDRASTERAFALILNGQTVTGSFTWAGDSRSFVFKAHARFQAEATYSVEIATTAQNRAHTSGLLRAASVKFTTVALPSVARVEPGNNNPVEPGRGAYIEFVSLMKFSTIKNRIVISPKLSDLQITNLSYSYGYPTSDLTDRVALEFQSRPETTYTVTLKAGVEDIYGNVIGKDFSFTFSTTTYKPLPALAYPILNGTIMTTGADNANSQISVLVRGKSTAKFALYSVTTEPFGEYLSNFQFGDYCRGSDGTMGYSDRRWTFDLAKLKPLREWEQAFNEEDRAIVRREVRLAQPGGTIAPGLYIVTMRGTSGSFQFVLAASTANITVKRTQRQIFAWVTDIAGAKPLANVPVTLYYNKNQFVSSTPDIVAISLGNTDAKGIVQGELQLPAPPFAGDDEAQLYVVAENEKVYGAWYSCLSYYLREPRRQAYLYTDRPIYRPGETVYVKGIVRARRDMTFTPLPKKTARIAAYTGEYYSYQDKPFFEADLPINANGSFSGEFQLPDNIAIGQASIQITYPDEDQDDPNNEDYNPYYRYSPASLSFTIAAFRPPEFAVSVKAAQKEIIQGDHLDLEVAATYYSGGGVNNASVRWVSYSAPAWFTYKGKGGYDFDDERWPYYYNAGQDNGTVITDDKGTQRITSKVTILSDELQTPGDGLGPGAYRTSGTEEAAPGKRPVVYITEATITDQAAQPVSGRTEGVFAHPANAHVGIEAQSWGAPSGQPLSIRLIAVRPDSTPIANQPIKLSISTISWKRTPYSQQYSGYDDSNPRWYQEVVEVKAADLRTTKDGTVVYRFTPSAPGLYRVAVQTTDEQGRVTSATRRLYITGRAAAQWNDPLLQMTPIPDKTDYKPGDVATINVPTGFAGRSIVLVTVERGSVITSNVVEANGPTLTYKLPVIDDYAPGAFVSFTVYRGIDSNHPVPDYRYGSVKINVEPVARRLRVTLTPSTTNTTPRGTVSFDIQVADRQGKPVSAEVGLALVDKSVLALIRPNSRTLEESFYDNNVRNYVRTNLSMFGYMPLLTSSYIIPCCFGGGGGGPFQLGPEGAYIRSNFKFTALWSPFVVTDKDGKATVTVTLPDNATTWYLDARAITANTLVGQGNTELIATLPLLMRPVAPRFLVAGDKVQLAAVINNNSGQDQTAEVSLNATGIVLAGPVTQKVFIPSGQRARITWNVIVNGNATNADLVFSVVGPNGYKDAARPLIATGPNGTIPIYQYVAYDNVATAGSLLQAGSRRERISIVPRLNTGQGMVSVRFDASLAAATIDSLTYLRLFPHDCIEQTVSKFLPNVVTLRALKQLNISDPKLEKGLEEGVRGALEKLERAQNSDGGWGWFPGRTTDLLVTAYALLGRLEAAKVGYNSYRNSPTIRLLQDNVIVPNGAAEPWSLNRLAFFDFVMFRAITEERIGGMEDSVLRQQVLTSMRALFERRSQLSYAARAYLLMAFHIANPTSSEVIALTADLESAAITTGTTAHWQEGETDWWNWGSDIRTTALALDALLAAKPDSPLLPQAVRWLMYARNFDHWASTQETTWSIIALTDWMVRTGELRGNYNYSALLNNEKLLSASITPQEVRTPRTLQFEVKKLLNDRINQFIVERGAGDGALYYTANLKLYAPADQVKAINRGVTITREYFVNERSRRPITSAQLGDVVTVRLTFTVAQDIRYFVLEDPIPAGTEGIDTSLLTTSISASGPDLNRVPGGDYYWYWGWWYIDRTEIRDQQVNLYAAYLPRGTYTFTYQLRTTIAGQFQTMPAHAYPFYFPDVFGRSEGILFTVSDGEIF